MSFVALILALLLEQVRPLPDGNVLHQALLRWSHWVRFTLNAGKPDGAWLAWGVALGVPSLLVLLVHVLLSQALGGFLAMVWMCVVLYACLGFRQFSHHFTSIRDAMSSGQYEQAARAMAQWRQVPQVSSDPTELTRQLIEYSVLSAHRHVFGVVFWFSVLAAFGLGPLGAVVYRLSEFFGRAWAPSAMDEEATSSPEALVSLKAWAAIDWVSARVTAMMFAIAGNFEDAMDSWRSQALRESLDNDEVLISATAGALGVQLGASFKSKADGETPALAEVGRLPQFSHLRSLVGLVWRTVVIWSVLLALMTMARLLS